jgi:hypothetical protein
MLTICVQTAYSFSSTLKTKEVLCARSLFTFFFKVYQAQSCLSSLWSYMVYVLYYLKFPYFCPDVSPMEMLWDLGLQPFTPKGSIKILFLRRFAFCCLIDRIVYGMLESKKPAVRPSVDLQLEGPFFSCSSGKQDVHHFPPRKQSDPRYGHMFVQ